MKISPYRITKIVAISVMCCILISCSDYKEINQVSFAIGIALDKKRDGRYIATLQVLNPSNVSSVSQSGGQGATILNYKGMGKTAGEAMWKSFENLPRPASFPHLQVVVISEEIAKEGLLNVLDLFEREPNIRLSTALILSHNTSARSILSALTPLNKVPSNSLVSNLENAQRALGTNQKFNISQVVQYIKNEGEDVAISTVGFPKKTQSMSSVSNLEKTTPIVPKIDGMALFKDDKWVAWRDGQGIRTQLIAYNQMRATYLTVPFEENKYVTLRLLKVKSKKYAEMKSGVARLKMDVKGIADIEELKGKYNIENAQDLQPLEKSAERELKNEIQEMIKLSQKYRVDTLGFGKQLSFQHPDQWERYHESWPSLYQIAKAEIHVDVSIKTTGSRTHSIQFTKKRGEN